MLSQHFHSLTQNLALEVLHILSLLKCQIIFFPRQRFKIYPAGFSMNCKVKENNIEWFPVISFFSCSSSGCLRLQCALSSSSRIKSKQWDNERHFLFFLWLTFFLAHRASFHFSFSSILQSQRYSSAISDRHFTTLIHLLFICGKLQRRKKSCWKIVKVTKIILSTNNLFEKIFLFICVTLQFRVSSL